MLAHDIGPAITREWEPLLARGYIIEDDMDKLWKVQPDRGEVGFTVCPTTSCNLRCTYCFQRLSTIDKQDMDMEVLELALVAMSQQAHRGTGKKNKVVLYGGEPLQSRTMGMVERVLSVCAGLSCNVTIITNGTGVESANALLLHYRDLINRIQITIDGPPEIHNRRRVLPGGDSFGAASGAIEWCLNHDLPVVARCNTDRFNMDSCADLVGLFQARGWFNNAEFAIAFAPVGDNGGFGTDGLLSEYELVTSLDRALPSDPALRRHIRLEPMLFLSPIAAQLGIVLGQIERVESHVGPRPYYCGAAAMTSYILAPNGLIYSCWECIGKEDHAIGRFVPELDVFPHGLWRKRPVTGIEECKECFLGPLCAGGCPMYAATHQKRNLMGPACEDRPQLFDYYMEKVIDRLLPSL